MTDLPVGDLATVPQALLASASPELWLFRIDGVGAV